MPVFCLKYKKDASSLRKSSDLLTQIMTADHQPRG